LKGEADRRPKAPPSGDAESETPFERRPKVRDQSGKYGRLRYTAAGALAALAAVGAIAVTGAFAAKPHAKPGAPAATGGQIKSPTGPLPSKTQAPPPPGDPQLFLNAIQRLVNDGKITATEARVVDREIVAGRVDTDSLTASGFTPAQLQAVQDALGTTKAALAASVHGSGQKASADRRARKR
jgi:hypothetical protein